MTTLKEVVAYEDRLNKRLTDFGKVKQNYLDIADQAYQESKDEDALAEGRNEQDKLDCEKCGEETSNRMVGDEAFDYCKGCNWVN